MRLIDDIRAKPGLCVPQWVAPRHLKEFEAYAEKAIAFVVKERFPIVLIDNVSDYYYTGTDQENWSPEKDFPNLAPPYQTWWMEHKLPSLIHSTKGDTDVKEIFPKGAKPGRVGLLFHAAKREDVVGQGIPPETHWILWSEIFIDYGIRDYPDGPHGSIFTCIDSEGRLIGNPGVHSYARDEDANMLKTLLTWLNPAFLAITFLHCKNVRIEEQRVPKPLAKRFKERRGIWPTNYHTLVIEPLKAILKTEGKSDTHGIAKAMHICRGHFKDYREGRGLFGKYHQLVWQPMLIRGTKGKANSEKEVVVKC